MIRSDLFTNPNVGELTGGAPVGASLAYLTGRRARIGDWAATGAMLGGWAGIGAQLARAIRFPE
jgi:hypothetical protein